MTLPSSLQAYYESMAREREPALDRLGDYFSEDIHFIDPFRDTRGLASFRTLFERMFRQYRKVEFTDFRSSGDESSFVLTYDMRLRMAIGPVFTTAMVSVCRARDGKVYELRDYYDFSSSLVSPWKFLARFYQALVRTLFL